MISDLLVLLLTADTNSLMLMLILMLMLQVKRNSDRSGKGLHIIGMAAALQVLPSLLAIHVLHR